MPETAAALLKEAGAAARRVETQARRIRQRLARAADEQHVLAWHTLATARDVEHVATLLHAAAQQHSRLHVVVLTDRGPDHSPPAGAQPKDPSA